MVVKSEEERPVGRPRRKWEDNIKMGLQVVGCRGMDLIELAQDRDKWRALVNEVINLHKFRVHSVVQGVSLGGSFFTKQNYVTVNQRTRCYVTYLRDQYNRMAT